MKKLYGVFALAIAVTTLAVVGVAAADQPPATTFIAVLSPDEEVPACTAATNAAGGVFIAHVTNEATGTVEWTLVANNLPGNIIAAHIHVAPKGAAGPVVQPTQPTPGEENGVIGTGTFSNPALVAALRANPDGYYVNVHTNLCPAGAARGQLGDHGPGNN
jgi:Cu/Zn superoxide dismutase